MIRRQPRSTRTDTLFPYTTLFRSGFRRTFPAAFPSLRNRLPAASGRHFARVAALLNCLPNVHSGGVMRIAIVLFSLLFGFIAARSEERRVGKECVSPCRSRWSPDH